MRTIVLSFERFPACSLGCYGEWNFSTPELDALASQSILFENYHIPPQGPSLLDQLHASRPDLIYLSGQKQPASQQVRPTAALAAGEVPGLTQVLAWFSAGENCVLFVDCLAETPWMGELISLALHWPAFDSPARSDSFPLGISISGTSIECFDQQHPDVRLEDSSLLTTCQSWPIWKQRMLAHGAHVQRCDDLLGRWLELLEQVLEPGDLLVLTGTSGDDRRIPDDRPEWLKSLAEPVVHLPLILHRVESGQQSRHPGFLTPETAAPLILQPDLAAVPSEVSGSKVIEYRSSLAIGRRSADWLFVEEIRSDSKSPLTEVTETEVDIHLFAKPQDIWERHNLSRQYPELVEEYQRDIEKSGRDQ